MTVTTPRFHCNTNRSGQALIVLTFSLVFLMGMMGLVVDLGYGYYVKQVAQAAVDAAVTAAITSAQAGGGSCGTGILCETNYTCPASPDASTDFGIACLYAKANGFTSTGNQTVTLSAGTGVPPANTGITTTYWITATATQTQPLSFMRVMGFSNATISAQATGAVVKGPSDGCIYVRNTMTVKGTSSVKSNCDILVNNDFTTTGNATVIAPVIDVYGTVKSTVPTQHMLTQPPDPLANLPAPPVPPCDHNAYSSSGGSITLNPGVYCGGISITGQAQITFNPGTYILNGGGLTSTSSNTTMVGNGVFFYNTSNGYTFAPISLAGGTSITLSAPTAGPYQGILFFQDRNITSSATNTIAGGSNPNMSGIVYMPTGDVNFVGNSTTALTMEFVVNNLTVTGTGTLHLQKDSTGVLTRFPTTVSLVQ